MSLQTLFDHADKLHTRMGKAFLGERVVYRGRDLHHDLGDWDWFRLYMFSITERAFTENQLKLLNYIWVATSYPDPGIWPNHVAALVGAARGTASLGLMAGLAVSEATIYGCRPNRKAIDFFYRAGVAVDSGMTVESFVDLQLQQGRTLYGYGRPLATIDERIPHTLKKVAELGLADGKYLGIALKVYAHLKATKGLSMNIAAVDAALCADLGLSPEEYHLFLTPCFIAGMTPCYLDARNKPEGAFFPMRCTQISYNGSPRRSW